MVNRLDQPSRHRSEAARLEVKWLKAHIEIDVQPLAAGFACVPSGLLDQPFTDTSVADAAGHRCVEYEGVGGTVPGHVDEADELAAVAGRDPNETMVLNLDFPVVVEILVVEPLGV